MILNIITHDSRRKSLAHKSKTLQKCRGVFVNLLFSSRFQRDFGSATCTVLPEGALWIVSIF